MNLGKGGRKVGGDNDQMLLKFGLILRPNLLTRTYVVTRHSSPNPSQRKKHCLISIYLSGEILVTQLNEAPERGEAHNN